MIDDHRLSAALGLRALARVVDDKRVQVRHRPEHEIGPAACAERHALAGQPFEAAVLADVHHGVAGKHLAQPAVERQVGVRGHEVGVVVAGQRVQVVTARRLDTDKYLPTAQPGEHKAPLAQHRVVLRRAPARQHRLAADPRQAREKRLVIGHGQALIRRAQGPVGRVVGDAGLEAAQQRIAVCRDIRHPVALRGETAQDGEHRRRRVQTHTVAQAPFTGGVVGQDQGQALVGVGLAAQGTPGAGQPGHEGDALVVGPVAHHVGLGQRAAVIQALETHRPGNNTPVHLRHRHVHGDVARPQALRVALPGRAVVTTHNELEHGQVVDQRVGRAVARGVAGERRAV